jgi:protein SCO1/2
MGAAALGWTALRGGSSEQPYPVRVTGKPSEGIPNVTLYTHEGKAVKAYDDLIRDKVVAINMMYTECRGICPGMTANLLRVQQMLSERAGRDVFMYSISLQPGRDTPHQLQAYAQEHGVGPGWLFLTGTPWDIESLRYGLGFYDIDPAVDANKVTHTGMVRIGNDQRKRWTMAPALAAPDQILAVINHVDPLVVHTALRPSSVASHDIIA